MQFCMNYEATGMHTELIVVAYPKQSWAMKGCFQVALSYPVSKH